MNSVHNINNLTVLTIDPDLGSTTSVVCACGEPSFPFRDLVCEFEHIHRSGHKNFALCRRPVRTNLNIPAWRRLLAGYSDELLCDMLEFGFPLDIQGPIPPTVDFRSHKGARDFPTHVDKYLHGETSRQRMAGPFTGNPLSVDLHYSPINTVPKDESEERRIIVDLSWPLGESVNDSISKDTYLGEEMSLRYTTIEDICNLVMELGPGCLIYKRDLRKAYRQIPIDPADYRYLGYMWNGLTYIDAALVMGQRNAAHGCQRTTNGVMFVQKSKGYRGKSYLDDLIGVGTSDDALAGYNNMGALLVTLGLEENGPKACPPSCLQTVLGVLFDTVNLTVSVTPERLRELHGLLHVWSTKKKCTKTELRSLLGKLCSVIKCVRQSRVFINRLLAALRSFPSQKLMSVSAELVKDVRWWVLFMEDYNGVSIIPPIAWMAPDVVFTTDSTLTGCGGLTDTEYFHSPFPPQVLAAGHSINGLEILAVTVAVRLWGGEYVGKKILVYCDNVQAVIAINTGKTREPLVGSCARQLWLEVARCGFQLKAVHLPGVDNRLADSLSRWHLGSQYGTLFPQLTLGASMSERILEPSYFLIDDFL